MSQNTLFDKVWAKHKVRSLPNGQDQILVGLHLIHEVTSPQAFPMIEERGLKVRFPHRTFATVDHIVPTKDRSRPLLDPLAEQMLQHLERNCAKHGIKLFNLGDPNQGIVHIIGPELGLTQPGMVIACGDSHTSTHGAFGAIALGVGTTQIASILATGCLLLEKPKVRRILVTGSLGKGVSAKDVILAIINRLGTEGGIGYAYEYSGSVISTLTMEGRMTLCNMSIEGGAQCGYVNPDMRTLHYIDGRTYAPAEKDWESFMDWAMSIASDWNAGYDDVVVFSGENIEPMMTWGIDVGQSIGVNGKIPEHASPEALEHMGFKAGQSLIGESVNVAFLGSCTNGRPSDFREAASLIKQFGLKVAPGVIALAVPGSEMIRKELEADGTSRILSESGWDWRQAGCSMCLAMNSDKLVGRQLCASSSNRNFKNRQGSPTGRTILMSPASVVACAARGVITDVRGILN